MTSSFFLSFKLCYLAFYTIYDEYFYLLISTKHDASKNEIARGYLNNQLCPQLQYVAGADGFNAKQDSDLTIAVIYCGWGQEQVFSFILFTSESLVRASPVFKDAIK